MEVGCCEVGPVIYQQMDNTIMTVLGRQVEWGVLVAVLCIQRSSGLEKIKL